MKWLKVFSVFLMLHVATWAAAHIYMTQNPATVLIIADTSFSMKPWFVDMQHWIDDYAERGRYRRMLIGTDKAMIGDLAEVKSRESIFRTAFGRSDAGDLLQYDNVRADEYILLSDGTFRMPGWQLVIFP